MPSRGCFTFPHGAPLNLAALVFGIAAYGCAVNTAYNCNFVKGTTKVEDDIVYPNSFFDSKIGLGLWNFEQVLNNSEECIEWYNTAFDELLDSAWKGAQGLAICANVTIGIAVISCFVMACVPFPNIYLKVIALLFFLGCVCECLVFIVFSSDLCSDYFDCEFSTGAATGVAAAILALSAAVLVAMIPPYVDEFAPGVIQPRDAPGTVTVKTIVEPDGTTKTITTTINADGSQTVEEVVEKSSPDEAISMEEADVEQPLASA